MNPALKKLGYSAQDRVLIIHADDIGMCQATLPALTDLLDVGIVSSAAVMVPCPWFQATAALCRAHPSIDMGVHLTLNAEMQACRWGPISTRDPASGLMDEQGYFHHQPPATEQQADPQAVATELQAQVTRALQAGIDATHVDTHMGTAFNPRFLPAYLGVAQAYQLPPFLLGQVGSERLYQRGMGRISPHGEDNRQLWQTLEERGIPLFDDVVMLPLNDLADQVPLAKQIIDTLQPGLTVLILHPAQDTPELRALAPDWCSRVANYQACLSLELREYLRQSGVQLIGYRPLRGLVRGESAK